MSGYMDFQHSGQDVYNLLVKGGYDPVAADGLMRQLQDLRKDAMPAGGRPEGVGRMYENSPFGLLDTDLWTHVVTGGSPLMNWIPSRKIKDRFKHVSHLDFIAPEGFDGSESYPDWLASISIGECGYGPSTVWSGFNYQMSGGSFSWTTEMMKPFEDGGIHYYEEQPLRSLRGSSIGSPISSDKQWAVARVLLASETHLDYVLKHGDKANSDMEWDGLDQIIRPGYVASHVYGSGVPTWADPIWVNGATIPDAATLLKTIRVIVRRLRKRVADRNWQLGPADMVVFMSRTMWDNIAETIAAGALYEYTNQFGFNGQQTFKEYRDEYRATKQGGMGFGTIDVDGTPIAVLTDGNMGANTDLTIAGPTTVPAIRGDVYILTRSINGMNLLEQQYVDWNTLDYPAINEEKFALMGGTVRAGWITESNKCYYYYSEMAGRMVCMMQPLQARISNVVIPTLDESENEAGAFYSQDFYAYNGERGGQGVVLLNQNNV